MKSLQTALPDNAHNEFRLAKANFLVEKVQKRNALKLPKNNTHFSVIVCN